MYVDGINVKAFRDTGDGIVSSGSFEVSSGLKGEVFVEKNTSWLDSSWVYRYKLMINGQVSDEEASLTRTNKFCICSMR